MKYYKQTDGETVIAYGMANAVPDGTTEITRAEYVAGLAALDKADADAKAKREAELEAANKAAAEAAEKAAAEHRAAVDDYVAKVKAGDVKLSDVPDEYRAEVDGIINPPVAPPTNAELNTRVEAAESAIDFLMTAVASAE